MRLRKPLATITPTAGDKQHRVQQFPRGYQLGFDRRSLCRAFHCLTVTGAVTDALRRTSPSWTRRSEVHLAAPPAKCRVPYQPPRCIAEAFATRSPIHVTSLSHGKTYTYTVQATNASGTGPASPPTTSFPSQATETESPQNLCPSDIAVTIKAPQRRVAAGSTELILTAATGRAPAAVAQTPDPATPEQPEDRCHRVRPARPSRTSADNQPKETQMRTKAAFVPVAVATCLTASSMSGLSHAAPADSPQPNHALVDKIVVASTRHDPTGATAGSNRDLPDQPRRIRRTAPHPQQPLRRLRHVVARRQEDRGRAATATGSRANPTTPRTCSS